MSLHIYVYICTYASINSVELFMVPESLEATDSGCVAVARRRRTTKRFRSRQQNASMSSGVDLLHVAVSVHPGFFFVRVLITTALLFGVPLTFCKVPYHKTSSYTCIYIYHFHFHFHGTVSNGCSQTFNWHKCETRK